MIAKLAALILVVAFTSAALLAVRQQRVEAAHDLARAHAQTAALERDLRRLRVEIARRVTPERVETYVASLGETEPILLDPELWTLEGFATRTAIASGEETPGGSGEREGGGG